MNPGSSAPDADSLTTRPARRYQQWSVRLISLRVHKLSFDCGGSFLFVCLFVCLFFCQAPGVIGSMLGLVGPVSVYCDWARRKVWSATSVSVWQGVELSEQIRPRDTLACWWDVKQATNQQTSSSLSVHKFVCYGSLFLFGCVSCCLLLSWLCVSCYLFLSWLCVCLAVCFCLGCVSCCLFLFDCVSCCLFLSWLFVS